ncbi:hypothetical protein [Streptomyces sp. ISL-100]|uniref:hypothetical protein n=1 Tax=Streptomyces sp. ISL-100 TaxID=2819173 RepID=UPI002034CC19|nr:hypothetical protein [Streptomyces sp. ISL-100]
MVAMRMRMRTCRVVVAGAAAAVMAVGVGGFRIAPEADVAYRGHAMLDAGRLGVWLETGNRGPSGLRDATVRVRFSVPLAGTRELPPHCLWGGEREALCRTGALRVGGNGRDFAFHLRTSGDPSEVVVRISTAWNGGATDRNPRNNEHEVLVPASGDGYFF